MARTRHTLKGDPSNPPKDLICGYCGVGHRGNRNKRMLETMKTCCVCTKPFPVHGTCAKTFFKKVSKKKETFDDETFLKATFKFYCHECNTSVCVTCEKEHPIGTPQSYIAVCSAKHWFVCTEKCLPSSVCKITAKKQWFCKLHQKEKDGDKKPEASLADDSKPAGKINPADKSAETVGNVKSSSKPSDTVKDTTKINKTPSKPSAINDDDEEAEHPYSLHWDPKKNEVSDQDQVVSKWFKNSRKGSFSMLEKKEVPEETMSKILTEFRTKVLSLRDLYNEESDEAKIQELIDAKNKLNKEFLVRCSLEEDDKNMIRQSGLLPYSISAGSIIRLKQEEGLEAYLNEELIYLFKVFMQEHELDGTNNVPHIYLPSCYEHILFPCESKYPATKFDHFLDKEWFKESKNRYQFFREYSLWFEKEARARLDIVFDCFKAKKMVSFGINYCRVAKCSKISFFTHFFLFLHRNRLQFQYHTTKVNHTG